MRIAVNAASLNKIYVDQFLSLAKLHTRHTFLFFLHEESKSTDLSGNIIPVIIPPIETNLLKRRIWYNLKLPAALKKNKADIFISERFISLKTKVPQIWIQPDLRYIHQPAVIDKKELRFYKKNTKKFVEKANDIIVNSFSLKDEITDRFKIDDKKITVIYPSIKENFRPPAYEEREIAKEKYAEGNEYFIYKGMISPEKNLINLLKAFSFFKKRQRSNMHLIITGERGEKYDEFVRSLQSYRFKNHVKLVEGLGGNETAKILSSAYAMVYVPFYESEADAIIEAMKCAVPLVVSSIPVLKEYCGEAALYVEAEKINDIAEKMMLLFKDEQKRKELIENGKGQLSKFSTQEKPDLFFNKIQQTIL